MTHGKPVPPAILEPTSDDPQYAGAAALKSLEGGARDDVAIPVRRPADGARAPGLRRRTQLPAARDAAAGGVPRSGGGARRSRIADLPWWEVFHDDELQALIAEALRNNYDLQTAVARVEQARGVLITTRSAIFPQGGYQGDASRGRQFFGFTGNRTFNVFAGTFNLAWELDLWGRIRRATEASQAELLATNDVRRGVVLTLVSEVAASLPHAARARRRAGDRATRHADVRGHARPLRAPVRGRRRHQARGGARRGGAGPGGGGHPRHRARDRRDRERDQHPARLAAYRDPARRQPHRAAAAAASRRPACRPPSWRAVPTCCRPSRCCARPTPLVGVAIADFFPRIGLTAALRRPEHRAGGRREGPRATSGRSPPRSPGRCSRAGG